MLKTTQWIDHKILDHIFLKKFCSSQNLNHVWDNQVSKHTNILCSIILNNLKCLYEKQWLANLDRSHSGIKGDCNLRTYCKFKKRI